MADLSARLARELRGLRSVACAWVAGNGRLLDANAGFLALLPPSMRGGDEVFVADAFIRPSFAELLGRLTASGAEYEGRLTLGDREGEAWTLRGRASRESEGLVVVAEHDVEELQQAYASTLTLNEELAETQRALARANRKIREVSLTDSLTGLANRRRLDEQLAVEAQRARRYGTPLSLVLCDIDHFKRVNDSLGHDVGDRVLARVASVLREQARAADHVARYGGEEFVVVLPHTGLTQAADFAARLRAALAHGGQLDAVPWPVTVSFGAAEWREGEAIEETLRRADAALYRAKEEGRDRVVSAPAG